MDGAWIAVIGTLGGVAVSASSALLGSLLTARHQRATADRQITVTTGERLRTEKRTTFVDYLVAYSDLRERILALARRADDEIDTPQPPTGRGHIDDFAPEEAARFSRAYHTLQITANQKTGNAANRCTDQLWNLADAAVSGDQTTFAQEKAAGKQLRHELRSAMREELGIT